MDFIQKLISVHTDHTCALTASIGDDLACGQFALFAFALFALFSTTPSEIWVEFQSPDRRSRQNALSQLHYVDGT